MHVPVAMVSRESQTATNEECVVAVAKGEPLDMGPYELVDSASDTSSRKGWGTGSVLEDSDSDLGEEDIFDFGPEPSEEETVSEAVSLEMAFEPRGLKSCLKIQKKDGVSRCATQCVEFSSIINRKYKRQYGGDPSELWVRADESCILGKILAARANDGLSKAQVAD